MSERIEFMERGMFRGEIKEMGRDEEVREVEKRVIEWGEKGDVMEKRGGVGKVRMGRGKEGKRGRGRVIYFVGRGEVIYVVMG